MGSSAQNGFKVVFQRFDKFDVINPSLSYFVSLLHKKLMGEKVFDTKMLTGDSLSPNYYTHCARNVSRAFTVMGVNAADYKTKTLTKLPNKYTGSKVYQYILSVDSGHILLNGIPIEIDSDFHPIVKIKKPNRPTTFTLPPRSIGFWVFPQANLQQCSKNSRYERVPPVKRGGIYNDLDSTARTTSEKLLHDLISEVLQIESDVNEVKRFKRHAIVKKDSLHLKRMRRDANPDTGCKTKRTVNMFKKFGNEGRLPPRVIRQIKNFNYSGPNSNGNLNRFGKLFKNFELRQPKKFQLGKFWNLPPPPAQNMIPQNPAAIPPVTSTIHDVYQVDPNEQIFKSVENSELPTGDVFFQVGDERNLDYVEFDAKSDANRQPNQRPVDNDFDAVDHGKDVPHSMYEFRNEVRQNPSSDMIPYTELWESDVYQKSPPPQAATNEHSNFEEENPNRVDQNIDMIVKELPPTFRQNQENLLKAKTQLSSMYVSDVDRLSPTNINMPIRQYDMDHDGFFVSKRKRRSIDAKFNDIIEKKVNSLKEAQVKHDEENFMEFLNRNGSRINLLEKVTRIIESLEKIDDLGQHKNFEKLTAEIKELEHFLLKRNFRFGLIKPKNRVTQKEVRRKCKILSVNLEQQCLNENDFYPSRLMNRDAKQSSYHSPNKIQVLKNVFPVKKSENLSRVRRNAVDGSASWEADDRNNMIVKEIYTANEMNDFVPSISYKKTILLADEPKKSEEVPQISVLQNVPDAFRPNSVVEQINAYQHPVPITFSIDTDLDGDVVEKDIENDHMANEYRTPRFMKKISQSVAEWMNIVEKHVSGWWNIMS